MENLNSIDTTHNLERLEKEGRNYSHEQDFYALEGGLMCKKYILPHTKDKVVLEMGCGALSMTRMFLQTAKRVDVVDGSESLTSNAQQLLGSSKKGGTAYHSLFENFSPKNPYQAVVFTNALHMLADPSRVLRKISASWLTDDGELVMTVHNVFSLHRKIGVNLGALKDEFSDTPFDSMYFTPGRFSRKSLSILLAQTGFEIKEMFGFYLRPFSYDQMARLKLSESELEALFETGRQFEDIAFSIFVRATAKK